MTDYLIIANGDFLVKEMITEAALGKKIIALDGAANILILLDILPQIILGDFDSISEPTAAYWGIKNTFAQLDSQMTIYPGNQGSLIVAIKDQNYTDLEKAIHYCDRENASSISIVCATGDRLDHQESVKMSLKTYYQKNRPIILYTELQCLFFARDEVCQLSGMPGDKCGFLATAGSKVSSTGLVYECQEHQQSFCNALAQSTAELHIQGEAWVFAPPRLASQRDYMKKTEIERLELLLRDRKQKSL